MCIQSKYYRFVNFSRDVLNRHILSTTSDSVFLYRHTLRQVGSRKAASGLRHCDLCDRPDF